MKMARYHEMQRSDIRQFVCRSSCKRLEDIITRAREWEIDLEMESKSKPNFAASVEGLGKRPNVYYYRPRGQHGRSHCGKCNKMHNGTCKRVGYGYFKCGRTGHISKYYTATTPSLWYQI